MSEATAHLSALKLEQLAEGALREEEAASAERHLAECGRCSAEFESVNSLFTALDALPRFAPSAAFSNAVMARVQIAAQERWYAAWLRRLVPTTRRGWVLLGTALTAPATPFLALAIWILFQPLITPTTLLHWAQLRLQAATEAFLTLGAEWVINSSAGAWIQTGFASLQGVSFDALAGVIAIMAAAIPLSAWTLVRLTRVPSSKVTYAN